MASLEGIVAAVQFSDTAVPMRPRFAPLVPLALTLVLAACANQGQQPQIDAPAPAQASLPARPVVAAPVLEQDVDVNEQAAAEFADHEPYELPQLADSVLE